MSWESAVVPIQGITDAATVYGANRIYSVGIQTDGTNAATVEVYWTNKRTGVREGFKLRAPSTGIPPFTPSLPIAVAADSLVIDPTGTGAEAWVCVNDYTYIVGGASSTKNLVSRLTSLVVSGSNLICRVTKA